MADKLGRDATEFRQLPEGGREPVITPAHKWGMILDLYHTGWSGRLIAQFCGMDTEEVFNALASNGQSMGVTE